MASSAAGKKNPITSGRMAIPDVPPSYWVTPAGKSALVASTALLSSAYFAGYTTIHTFLLDRYMDAVHLYKHGLRTPLTPGVAKLCEDTLQELQLKRKAPISYRFFSVFGFDMFHAGSTKLKGGAIVGVPRNFSYGTEIDFERHDIRVDNKSIEWGTEGGQMLMESLTMSERAKKFAIAREIMMADTHAPYSYGSVGPIGLMSYFYITKFLNYKLQGFQRAKSFRVFMYSLVGTFTLGVCFTLHDSITKYYERWADNKVGTISMDYARGGVEFYSKILQRNMGLRALMGPSGESSFTFYGNDVELIRQRHIPYTERKRNLELIAEKLAAEGRASDKDGNNNSEELSV